MTEDISFSPTTGPRQGQVYASYKLLKAMRYAAKREKCTVEDLFETVITAHISAKHPDIIARVNKLDEDEKAWLKSLEKQKEPDA